MYFCIKSRYDDVMIRTGAHILEPQLDNHKKSQWVNDGLVDRQNKIIPLL